MRYDEDRSDFCLREAMRVQGWTAELFRADDERSCNRGKPASLKADVDKKREVAGGTPPGGE
jgi:hypothetical protein